MNNITKELNIIYINNKDKELNILIDELLNYFQTINYNNELFNILKNNKEILLNSLEYNIFDDIEDLLNHNINNYKLYELLMINILNDIILKNKLKTFDEYLNEVMTILNVNKINNYYILRNQYYYITNNSHKLIPLNNIILYNEKEIEEIKKDYKLQKRNYKLLQTKEFDNNNIIRSYLCYFKSAINIIINHPLFLKITNIDSDSLKLLKGGYYHPYEILMYGGNELWNELSNENINLINLLKIFQNITNNYYILGLPGIKYYPHIILQYLLYFLNNDFSKIFKIYYYDENFYYLISINDNIFLDIYDIDYTKKILNNRYCMNYIKDYLLDYEVNNDSFFIDCTINDPLCYNSFNILLNKRTKINNINNKTLNNLQYIKDNNIKYQYDFFINNYYLQSFIVIENIKNSLSFHCVYFKIIYDNNYNIINIIRYDDKKKRFLNNNSYYNLNNDYFMIYEMNIFINQKKLFKFNKTNLINNKIIFNQSYINDYFDNKYYYKICLVCYCKK